MRKTRKGKRERISHQKKKEHEEIHTLVNFPTTKTPTKLMSTDMVPLKISAPGSSSNKVTRALHYGDLELDEEIETII